VRSAARIAAVSVASALLLTGCGGGGTGWQRVPAPDNDDTHLVVLDDDTAWLLGNGEGPAGDGNTGLVWDGDGWAKSDDPVLGSLTGAVAVSSSLAYGTSCTATRAGVPNDCSLLRWSGGHRWRRIDVPAPAGDQLYLAAVAAAGPNDAWIGGTAHAADFSGGSRPYAAHWDGHRLTVTPAPLELSHLIALAPDDVWGWGSDRTAVAHWDGTGWRAVPLPGTPTEGQVGVGADSAGTVYATTADPGYPLVRWQGGDWHRVAVPAGVTVPPRAALGPAARGLWIAAYRGRNKECALLRDGHWSFSALPAGPRWSGTPSVGEAPDAPIEVDGFVPVPGGSVWAYGIAAVIQEPPPSDDSTRHRIIWRYVP
jgi:hypothetical protein